MAKNDLLKRQQEKIDRFVDATEEIITQYKEIKPVSDTEGENENE